MDRRDRPYHQRKRQSISGGTPAPLAAPSPSKDLNTFLTVYLRFLWQRHGLSRPSDLQPELTPLTTTIFLLPVGSSLSIIPVCVLSFSTASTQPHTPHLTRTAANRPVAPVTEYANIHNTRFVTVVHIT